MESVSPEDVVVFARRDWGAVDAAKTSHWLRRKEAMSSMEVWQLGAELWRHGRTVAPDGQTMTERAADLAVHQRVARALRAVAHAAR